MCARFLATPKESHHKAVKHILRYLAHTPTLGLWYPKGSTFDLIRYSDSDYAGDRVDRKSTSGTCHFLGRSLVCWSRRNRTAYHCLLLKLSTLLLVLAVLNCSGWSKLWRTTASTWRMCLSTVTMRVQSRLLTTQFSTRRQSTSRFIIIFFVIMCWRATSPSTTQALKTSWPISSLSPWMSRDLASCGVS